MFVKWHFFRADELRQLLSENGYSVAAIAGSEGGTSNFEQPLRDASAEALWYVAHVVCDPGFREDPTVIDMSNHILAVACVSDRVS